MGHKLLAGIGFVIFDGLALHFVAALPFFQATGIIAMVQKAPALKRTHPPTGLIWGLIPDLPTPAWRRGAAGKKENQGHKEGQKTHNESLRRSRDDDKGRTLG